MMNVESLGFWNDILIALISLLSTLAAMWLRNHLQQKKLERHNNLDEMQMQLDEANLIHDKLDKLREEIDCDRLNVYQFHNGERFIGTGDSFKRLSNTYELCKIGISSEVHMVQSLPMTLYSIVIKYLSTHPYLYAKQIRECEPLRAHRGMLVDRGVESVYKVPIRNLQGRMIAYICAEWVRGEHEFNQADVDKLQSAAALISGYLHTSYKATK